MSAHLQAENQRLQLQLQTLIEEARLNDRKMQRFYQLERCLIGTQSLAELVQLMLRDYKTTFALDAVTLVLGDPEYEISRILENEATGNAGMDGLILLDTPAILENLYDEEYRPFIGAFDAPMHGAIFDQLAHNSVSVVLLPLRRHGRLIGSLNLGSRRAERFAAGSATDFLERLADIFAICFENALNHERLKLMGLTDALTGINNRRYFESRCREEITHARRHKIPLGCMFLDVDKFKRINDTLGHQAGDEVLRNVARLAKLQLRANDIIARYGGEEFVVLLPQTAMHQACEIAERIRAAIAAHVFEALPGERIHATISIGVSTLALDALESDVGALADRMIGAADEAVYQAKEGGRNRVVAS